MTTTTMVLALTMMMLVSLVRVLFCVHVGFCHVCVALRFLLVSVDRVLHHSHICHQPGYGDGDGDVADGAQRRMHASI